MILYDSMNCDAERAKTQKKNRQIYSFLLVIFFFSRFVSVAQDWQYGTRCKLVATTAHLAGRPYRAHTEAVCVRACEPPQAVAANRCACVCQAPADVVAADSLLLFRSTNLAERSGGSGRSFVVVSVWVCGWCGHALAAIRLVSMCHVLGLCCAANVVSTTWFHSKPH